MLVKYLITDNYGIDYGLLAYDPKIRVWNIEINPARTWDDTPLSLAIYIRNGIYSLDEKQSLSWVRDRLLPPNRQNIHHVLREMNIPEYDEFALIQRTRGTSPNDELFLVEKHEMSNSSRERNAEFVVFGASQTEENIEFYNACTRRKSGSDAIPELGL